MTTICLTNKLTLTVFSYGQKGGRKKKRQVIKTLAARNKEGRWN